MAELRGGGGGAALESDVAGPAGAGAGADGWRPGQAGVGEGQDAPEMRPAAGAGRQVCERGRGRGQTQTDMGAEGQRVLG